MYIIYTIYALTTKFIKFISVMGCAMLLFHSQYYNKI